MTSRERLLTTLNGDQPDRVPVTIYECSHLDDSWVHQEPSYAPLLDLERRYGDGFARGPIDYPILIGDPNAADGSAVREDDGSFEQITEIDTPKGKLRTITRRDPEMMTYWQIEPLIKSNEDIEKVLSLPDPPAEINVQKIKDLEAKVGDDGIIIFSLGDAIGHVVGLFDFEDFVIRCCTDEGPIIALLDKAQDLILKAVGLIGSAIDNACFRLWGPEYCAAPLMNPLKYFERYVVNYDRPLTEAIHATDNLSVIHSHGRLNDILDMIVDIGADALEPIETLPASTADVTLAQVKQRIGDKICLMGAIQALTIETASPDEVKQQVREAIEIAAGGGGFVILPTAGPFMIPLDQKYLTNIEAMYLAAQEFGKYK